MKNKNVGMIIIGMAIVIGIIVFLFNSAMTKIVSTSCSHGPSCEMYGDIKTQTYVSMSIIGIIVIIGLVLIFVRENERIVIKKIKPYLSSDVQTKKIDKKVLNNLAKEESEIIRLIQDNKGSLYQSKLVQVTGMNKVKVTRILDSLEAQGLIERRRRGMTNIVLLKQ
jgi:uncharacterized membrane protein